MTAGPLKVGVIGAGVISHAYLRTIVNAPELHLKSISSLGMRSAETQAQRYGCVSQPTDAILADTEIDIVVNLAPPSQHHALGLAALRAGKHLYSEKPFATSLADARELIAAAATRGLKIGSAPDTFLGAAHQRARQIIDSDLIGTIVGGAVVMASNGMEHWHPNPAFFYDHGGGPLLDIGPYMITQMVNLLGPIAAVTAIGTTPRLSRTVTSPDRAGETIEVKVPTTVNGALRFESGANVALTLSWDVVAHRRSAIELYGRCGSIATVTPNNFDGEVRVVQSGNDWQVVHDLTPGPPPKARSLVEALAALKDGIDPMTGNPVGPDSPPLFGDLRGLGLIDMARAIRERREPRASADLAFHVLEVLLALEACAVNGGALDVASRTPRPQPVQASQEAVI